MPARRTTSSNVDPRARRSVSGGRHPRPVPPRHRSTVAAPVRRRAADQRRTWLAVVLAVVLVLVGIVVLRRERPLGDPWQVPAARPVWSPAPAGSPPARVPGGFPTDGPGTFAVHASPGPVLGRSGSLRRFQVAVEDGVPEDLDAFAATIDATLGDPRGWAAGKRIRMRRVGRSDPHDFTIYLATESTTQRMCTAGGVDVRFRGVLYTS